MKEIGPRGARVACTQRPSLADLREGAPQHMPSPMAKKFAQYHAVFWKIWQSPASDGWAPSYGKSWIRPCRASLNPAKIESAELYPTM